MPSWKDVLDEIQALLHSGNNSALDVVRRKYVMQLATFRKRNVICYYSGWLQKPNVFGVEIDDNDKNAFMSVIHKLDRTKGLDLILHTPGGQVAATESLVHYLREMFDKDIVAFVPQIAMSAGTMIACSCCKIYMGKQSNLGPIDPQFGGVPASEVIEEFENAAREISKNPSKIPLWQVIIGKYHPTLIGECKNAIQWSKSIVREWLSSNMLTGSSGKETARKIVSALSNHGRLKTHHRHLHRDVCRKMGLLVVDLESDQNLQDLVLTVHHAFMHTLTHTSAIKIIENHVGIATVQHAVPMPAK